MKTIQKILVVLVLATISISLSFSAFAAASPYRWKCTLYYKCIPDTGNHKRIGYGNTKNDALENAQWTTEYNWDTGEWEKKRWNPCGFLPGGEDDYDFEEINPPGGHQILKDGKHTFRNFGDTEFKNHYLDLNGTTGEVILHPTIGDGGYWQLKNQGNNIVTLQSIADTDHKNKYLGIDGNGEVKLYSRLGSAEYWLLNDEDNGRISLKNLGDTKFKNHYLDLNDRTGKVILHPHLGGGGYWK